MSHMQNMKTLVTVVSAFLCISFIASSSSDAQYRTGETTKPVPDGAIRAYNQQTENRMWIVTLSADMSKLYSDFVDNRFSNGGSISLKRLLMPLSDRQAIYGSVIIGAYDLQWRITEDFLKVNDTNSVKLGDINRTFALPVQLLGYWKAAIGPQAELFLGTGLEFTYFSPQNDRGNSLPRMQEQYANWTVGIPLTAELEYMLTENLALNLHANYHATFTDYLDNYSKHSHSDTYLTAGIGISYSFPAATIDSDYDGISNQDEREIYHTNPYDADSDHDGLSDLDEISNHTDQLLADTDGDGLPDGEEVHRWGTNPLEPDTDSDGLTDMQETVRGTSPVQADTDSDGLNDQIEVARGTNPLLPDTDGDGLPDGLEPTTSPLIRDTDGDGLSDAEESGYCLLAYDEDFDKDGLYDGLEIRIGTDPKKPDTDNDGASDYAEYYGMMSDPRNPDTDGDGIPDGYDQTPLGATNINPIESVAWTFSDLFTRQNTVDEQSKSFILLLHLLRSAPRGLVPEVTIEIYGDDTEMVMTRKGQLDTFLRKLTRGWSIPKISYLVSTRATGLDARLDYEWDPAR
jgi:hypothetical protein